MEGNYARLAPSLPGRLAGWEGQWGGLCRAVAGPGLGLPRGLTGGAHCE